MHCTLKSVCTGAKVMEDPRRVPWHRAVGLLDKEGPGGDVEGLSRSLRPHLSISRWVRPNVDLCRFMSIIWAWIPFWSSNCFHSFCLINSNPIKELSCVFATLEVVARRVLLGSNESNVLVLSSLHSILRRNIWSCCTFLDWTFCDSCFFVGFAKEMEKNNHLVKSWAAFLQYHLPVDSDIAMLNLSKKIITSWPQKKHVVVYLACFSCIQLQLQKQICVRIHFLLTVVCVE